MIDLLKQYVDSGVTLSEHQLMKLPKNLAITYIRRISIDRNLVPYMPYEVDKIVELFNNGDIKEGNLLKNIIIRNPKILKNLNIKSENFLIDIIQIDPYIIQFIENASEKIQFAAFLKDEFSFQFIMNPTEEVQYKGVARFGDNIKHILNRGIKPSEKVQLAAVRNDGESIIHLYDYGINPSEDVQIAAIRRDITVMDYIQNPNPSVRAYYNNRLKSINSNK